MDEKVEVLAMELVSLPVRSGDELRYLGGSRGSAGWNRVGGWWLENAGNGVLKVIQTTWQWSGMERFRWVIYPRIGHVDLLE